MLSYLRLIKATSRELSHVMLFAMLFSYMTVFLMLVQPSDTVCSVQYYGLHLAFTLSYAPLLTKVNRIHRLFSRSGVTGTQRPKWTSSRDSLFITAILVLIQVFGNFVPWQCHIYPLRTLFQLISAYICSYPSIFTFILPHSQLSEPFWLS